MIGLLVDVDLVRDCISTNTTTTESTVTVAAVAESSTASTLVHVATTATSVLLNETSNLTIPTHNETLNCAELMSDIGKAQWSFLISGCFYLLIPTLIWVCITFFASVTRLPKVTKAARVRKVEEKSSTIEKESSHKIASRNKLLSNMFVFCVATLLLLTATSYSALFQFLPTLTTLGLGWHVKSAAFLSTTLGVAVVASRLAAILVSAIVKSTRIIFVCLALCILGSSLMACQLLVSNADWIMWVGSLTTGFALAPIIPACYVWTNEVTGLSPTQSAIIATGMIAGYSIGPLITSALTNTLGYLAMIYVVFVCCTLECIAGIVLRVIDRQLKKTLV